ncbi:KIP2 [Sanghuangporus sanghuang]
MAARDPKARLQNVQNKHLSRVGSNASLKSLTFRQSSLAVGPGVKKYKAPLSVEAKTRRMTKSSSTSVLESPRTPSRSRSSTPLPPGSPCTPRTPVRSQSRCDDIFVESEMDVSRVDPEQALVDAENVDVDLSFELDERELRSLQYGREDKVHVSIRVRPTDETQAWAVASAESSLKLLPQYHKSTGAPLPQYHYDEVLAGSDNKVVYNATARGHVEAAMNGFNAVVFAYGQTASGKTFTLSGSEEQPGIIPRAMKDVFGHIRRTPSREYLLRCSYLEIYNESIFDLLAPPSARLAANTVQIQGIGETVVLSPLREEVVTSLKGVHDVVERGYANRRTASTDWNERSSRSHSVFRLVIESRERGSQDPSDDGRATPFAPHMPGGARLQNKNGRSVQMSVLSLIDLAGSEKASSDKDRTREGRYINTSLLTLGSVIGTLAENSAKGKNDHVPFRNSKLTRMLQPSLSGNARISVICTINPVPSALAETTSSLLFAQRVKRVQLNAKKKEVVDTDALLERYRKEIEDLKQRLAERETVVPTQSRRLSAKEQLDESRAMHDLNSRIQQLTRLILTSQSVDEMKGDQSRPSSPSKPNFDLEPYQLQQELLSARRKIESQATQILSLEAALLARPGLPADAPENEKDKLIIEQMKTIRELEFVVRGYEENLGEPLRAVKENVEAEWHARLEEERKVCEVKVAWADQLVRQLEKEKSIRLKLEEERRALAAFVSRFDSLGLASAPAIPSRLRKPTLPFGSKALTSRRHPSSGLTAVSENVLSHSSPFPKTPTSSEKVELARSMQDNPNLFDTDEPDFSEPAEFDLFSDASIQHGLVVNDSRKFDDCLRSTGAMILPELDQMKISVSPREALQDKENVVP